MNFDCGSSDSSDEIYDWMLLNFIEENKTMQVVEDAIRVVAPSATKQRVTKGSNSKKTRTFLPRDREGADDRLISDYFSNTPLYDDKKFRRRFLMQKHVFIRIVDTLTEADDFFKQRPDATGRLGASPLQKCTAAIRMLAYDTSADHVDEYLKYQCTQRSPVFDDLLNGRSPQISYVENGNTYTQGYYLTDGIYPKWAGVMDAITAPQKAKKKLFSKRQESVRKDVERAFGVLQARFAIIRNLALVWTPEILWKIMMVCIIMHNMIVEDERESYQNYRDPCDDLAEEQPENVAGSSTGNAKGPFLVTRRQFTERNLNHFMARREDLRNKQMHMRLKNDLEHIWRKYQGSIS
ncbi:uncharacterized protein LOC110708802 [Chenopodium quinoa]|uniref:uncharacterized protein LOC110708802 n=1 Tax=Chenopodium quinoa TaxID=63459 RepID=UPI000B78F72C|nr:uncharacterized protein LOC110708802 [Chenopodium quinoa]